MIKVNLFRLIPVCLAVVFSLLPLHIYPERGLTNAASAQPVANFSAEPQSGKGPMAILFTDLSTGDIDTWEWDFGDGPAKPLSSGLPWLHADGKQIVDQNGQVVVLRGVAVEDPAWADYYGDFSEAHFAEMANWGINVVRVPFHPDLWENDPEYAEKYLEPIVFWGQKYGMYILLGWHAHGNPITGDVERPSWGYEPPWHGNPYDPDLNLAISAWHEVAERYKDKSWVIYSLFNEPHSIAWADWRPVAEQLIDVIRSHNSQALVLVSGVHWGYDLREAGADSVQRANIAYESHPYAHRPDWDMYFGYLADTYPVFIGEWGYDPNSTNPYIYGETDTYGKPLLDYMRQKGMGWTAWCFSPSWEPGLLQDWNYTPTESGQLVKNHLKNTFPSHVYFVTGDYTVTLTVSGPNGFDTEVKQAYIEVVEASPNTPVGENVVLANPEFTVQFSEVTSEGMTQVVVSDTNPAGPTPSSRRVVGPFVDITTTAAYNGVVTVAISYSESNVENESNLLMFHWGDNQWQNVTTSQDLANNVIYGQTSSLSPFFLGEQIGDSAPPAPSGGGGGGCFITSAAYCPFLAPKAGDFEAILRQIPTYKSETRCPFLFFQYFKMRALRPASRSFVESRKKHSTH